MKLEQQHGQVDKESSCQVVLRHCPRAQVLRKRERELERAYLNSHRIPNKINTPDITDCPKPPDT